MKRRLELKAARVRKGWTQLHLAIIMSVSQQTIAKWEQGQNAPSTLRQIRQLQDVLDIPMETLFPDIFGQNESEGDSVDFRESSLNSAGSGRASKDQPMVGVRHDTERAVATFLYRKM